jgi:hypothetical protein
MSNPLLPALSGAMSAHYYNLKTIDNGLLAGRKVIFLSACLMPIVSCVSSQAATVLSIAFMSIGLISLIVGDVFSKKENINKTDRVIVNLCHKVLAYCFPLVSGVALSNELISIHHPIIAVISGISCAIILSAIMYEPIQRKWV